MQENNTPLRIELATSELEGGQYLSWVDPEQVLACVAQAHPRETFSRFLEPRLADLGMDAGLAAPSAEGLPVRLQVLLQRVRQAHVRLFREAKDGQSRPSLRPVLGLVEDRRIYFVRAIPSWVFRLRDGGCELITPGTDAADAAQGLGSAERLSLSVTSLEIDPGDVVVFLACDTRHAPDPRAVGQAVEQHPDLKRACDGIVNLFAYHSTGVGAVALRFVPIEQIRGGCGVGVSLLEDLERELASAGDRVSAGGAADDSGRGPVPGPGSDSGSARPVREVPLPDLLESLKGPVLTVKRAPSAPSASTASNAPPATAAAARPPAASEAQSEPAGHAPAAGSRRWFRRSWLGVLALVAALGGGLALAGIPGRIPGPLGMGTGTVKIEPQPAASRLLLDGADLETGTPAVLSSVRAGSHRLAMDFGAYGGLEMTIRVKAGETTTIRPQVTGGVEVQVSEPRPGSIAWTGRHARTAAPCRLDSLPIGWQTLAYQDDRLPYWQRQVLIRAGETTRVRVNNGFSEDRALVRVESWFQQAGRGLRESEGDSVFIDGVAVGFTPWEEEVEPGLHGVRVSRLGEDAWTEIIDVRSGSSEVVASRFGMGKRPRILHQAPGRIVLRDPIPLTARFVTGDGSMARNPRVHMPLLDASVRDVPLTPVASDPGAFVALIPAASIPLTSATPYYFTVQTDDGATLSSELFHLEAVAAYARLNRSDDPRLP